MPRYVTIRSKKNPNITKAINADIWASEKERHKANPNYNWEEVQPVTVTIPRRSANVEIQPEKKSQDVAGSLTPILDKTLNEIVADKKIDLGSPEAVLEEIKPKEPPADLNKSAPEADKVLQEEKIISQPQIKKEEPKKRGRPKRV